MTVKRHRRANFLNSWWPGSRETGRKGDGTIFDLSDLFSPTRPPPKVPSSLNNASKFID
jgi:hypothetical protein